MLLRTRTFKHCSGWIQRSWKRKRQQAGIQWSYNITNHSRALHMSMVWHVGCGKRALMLLCKEFVWMVFFINCSHPFLKHLNQDYAVNLHQHQRLLFIHFGLLMALCWLCEVSSFKGRWMASGTVCNGLLSLMFSLFAQQCSVSFEEESYRKSDKCPLWFQHQRGRHCNSAGKVFTSTLSTFYVDVCTFWKAFLPIGRL